MNYFTGFITGVQVTTIAFFAYMIHRVRKYEENKMNAKRHAVEEVTEMMKRFQDTGKEMHSKMESIVNDPAAHELKMLCVDCQESWFPKSSEEMAPCPGCGSMQVTGSA